MATNLETIRRITIEARTAGVEQANARLADTTRAIGTMEGAVARVRRSYDPLYSATERLTAVSRTLALAVAAGRLEQEEANRLYDQAAAKITNFGRAVEGASRAQQQWNALSQAGRQQLQQVQAASTMAVANRSAGERLGSLSYSGGSALSDAQKRAMASQVDPLADAAQKRDAQMAKADAALKVGAISQEQHARAVTYTTATYNAQETAVRRFIANTDASGKAAKLSAYELQNLGYQANDVFSSLSSGISPMQTLAQQGPQVYQILAGSSGGLAGGLKAAGAAAAGFLAPFAAIGTTVGGVVALGAAWRSYVGTQTEVQKAVAGVGGASRATVTQINAAAAANAEAGGVSVREARSIAAQFASTGRIGVSMYGDLIRTTKDYAATTSQDVPDAAKALAQAFASPATGAGALAKQLGFLNGEQLENIERMARQGEQLGAQQALMGPYRQSLTKAAELTSGWSSAVGGLTRGLSDLWDMAGRGVDKALNGGTLDEQLTNLDARLKAIKENNANPGFFGPNMALQAQIQAQRDEIAGKIAKREQDNAEKARNLRSLEIKTLVDGYNQADQLLKKLEDDAKNIAKALREGTLDPSGNSQRLMSNLLAQAQQLKTDMASGGAAYADALRAARVDAGNVGATPYGSSASQIQATAESKRVAALRDAASNSNFDQYAKALASINEEEKIRLDTLRREQTVQQSQTGGAFARAPANIQQQILEATARFRNVSPGLAAAILEQESNFTVTGPTRVRNPDGTPKTTAWGLGQITDPAQTDIRKIPGLENFDKKNVDTQVLGSVAYLSKRLDWVNQDVAKAVAGYGEGPAYAAQVFRKMGGMGDVSTEGLVKTQDALSRAARDAGQANDNLARNYGKNGEAAEIAAARQAKYNELIDAGRPAAEAASIAFGGLTDQIVKLGRTGREIQFQRDLDFERQQLGRSSADQSIYSQVRNRYGDTTSDEARTSIASLQDLGMMKEVRGTFQDTFGGVVSSLSRGSTAAQTFAQALSRLGDKLINMGTDALGGVLFGGGKGGGGGIFGSLIGSLAGTGGLDIGAASWMPKFADGGIMTSDGPLPLRRYAAGGIANSPQVAIFGEKPGVSEAYVPLPDGRRIPVAMQGAAANQNSMTDARQYSFDLRGSNLTEAQVQVALTRAIAANNQEQYRTQTEQTEAYRRMHG